jgi:ATP-dependent Lhr-like helicase
LTEPALAKITDWFKSLGWEAQKFQTEVWHAALNNKSGLLNAPTGSGKTYALLLPFLNQIQAGKGLSLIWICPIRALSKELELASQRAINALNPALKVGIRTGDTSTAERKKQSAKMPDILITTPESLHLLLAQKNYPAHFKNLQAIIVDEWHELLGSKRGVQMQLAISRLAAIKTDLLVWGISATIGNLDEAEDVLFGDMVSPEKRVCVKANIKKEVEIVTVMPDKIENFPWAGHLGLKMLKKIEPLILQSESVLIFTNTRSFAEIWYQQLLESIPTLAGTLAMHHGSISKEMREWVEDNLHRGNLKAVVCTSSLDLGVDFRPVDTVIQIGSPKGIARFLQRAGRSGHQPGKLSRIYFVPTHSLEIIEGAALRQAMLENDMEQRIPYVRSFDVLLQYLMTLAVSDGFKPDEVFLEVKQTFAFQSMEREEFEQLLRFMLVGGEALQAYEEFKKVTFEDGCFKVKGRRQALLHRLNIGTIVSDASLRVKLMGGKNLGSIEEWFIARLKPGEAFVFAGRVLELIQVKNMEVLVKPSKSKNAQVPSWTGGRMPLSANLSDKLRKQIHQITLGLYAQPELEALEGLFAKQSNISLIPNEQTFLLEYFQSDEGHHLFAFPFEGRLVNQGLAGLLAYRIALFKPISFSIAINDYGFELLSSDPIPIQEALDSDVFTEDKLTEDVLKSLNETEMAKRKFRDICRIAGLIFQGYPGQQVKQKHLQANSQLFYEVFKQYDADNLLLKQAHEEVLDFELDWVRLRQALKRINKQEVRLCYTKKPSPLAFPIMADRLNREQFSNESREDIIRKLLAQVTDD